MLKVGGNLDFQNKDRTFVPEVESFVDKSKFVSIFEVLHLGSGFPTIENRIYREELKESLGMNFVSPFQPEREFKVYKSSKCSQII